MADVVHSGLPFKEQAEFFRRKLNLPTNSWTDIYTQEHDWAFVVAGANRDAIVSDFRTAVDKAITGGSTLEDFRKDFDRIVAKHGWDYNGGRNWRSKVIYETNLNTSFAAGRWEQLQHAPYWQYEHSDWVEHPRAQHVAFDGLVLERDNPWWKLYFPPNGWGCQCKVKGLWQRDLLNLGKQGPDPTPEVKWAEHLIGQRSPNGPRLVNVPEGIDPGFEYAPGSARLRSAIPPERPTPPTPGGPASPGLPPLPAPRPVPGNPLLPPGLPPEEYVKAFLQPLGGTLGQPTVVRDVIGERMVVGKEMFQSSDGAWTVIQRGSEAFVRLLAQALLHPDEIWARLVWLYDQGKAVLRRRYIARFAVEGQDMPAVAVFEQGSDGWSGVTTFQSAEAWRVGTRLYSRNDTE